MTSPWAAKLEEIQPFHAMAVLARAKALAASGRDIVRLEVGEPDFPTPEPVLRAAQAALARDLTRYTPALGIPELRQAIARWYGSQYGVDLDPNRVIATPGTSGAFLLAFGLLLNPGDRFAISDPGYPCYANVIRFVGGEPVRIPAGPADQYQLSPTSLAPHLAQGLRGALVTSPSNPTGSLIRPDTFRALLADVEAHGGRVIADEIYHGVTYGERARSALEFSDQAFVIHGFSKFFAMTGWRLGWLVVPAGAVEPIERLAQNLFIAAPTLSQHAALAAFDCLPQLEAQVRAYDINRRFLVDAVRELGFEVAVEPLGAFYVYADARAVLRRTGHADSQALCEALLEEAGVALTPGRDFGQFRAGEHLRFSYATELARIQEGVARLGAYLARY